MSDIVFLKEEVECYEKYLEKWGDSGVFDANNSEVLNASNLPADALNFIWNLVNPTNTPYLDRFEFYSLMRYISLYQQNIDIKNENNFKSYSVFFQPYFNLSTAPNIPKNNDSDFFDDSSAAPTSGRIPRTNTSTPVADYFSQSYQTSTPTPTPTPT